MLQEVNDEELKKLQQIHSDLISEYEDIIKQKIGIFTEMLKSLKSITAENSTFIKNEEVLSQKKLQIEICERDIYQKRRVELDFAREVQREQGRCAEHDHIIADRKRRIEELQKELEEAERELQEFIADNAAKDDELAEMENNIQTLLDARASAEADDAEKRRRGEEERKSQPAAAKPKAAYAAMKGDRVDELMAIALNLAGLDMPVQRLGEGNYMFGTRKIYCKILNDKLVVRVGGGYMLIDEFLQTYGTQELEKVKTLTARGTFTPGQQSPGRMKSPGWKGLAQRASPTARA
jgi:chromosome segregation ATPase